MSLMVSQPKIDISSPVQPTAAFDPPVVGPGQQAIYRVTFNALEETIDWPEKINAPAGLPMTPGAHGEILRMGPGSFLPLTAFNYHVRPTSPGTFNVAGFTVNVYGKPVTVPPRAWTWSRPRRRRHNRLHEFCWNCRRPISLSGKL